MKIPVTCLLLPLIFLENLHKVQGRSILTALQESVTNTDRILKDLELRWDIVHYPLFLYSGYMSVRSWDYLKHKFEQKILSTEITPGFKNFTVSFTGSSVTAGHDSDFRQAFPAVVEDIMHKAFEPLNINFITRNVAYGNNPCLPYDACVRTFAGDDADIVVWEQVIDP